MERCRRQGRSKKAEVEVANNKKISILTKKQKQEIYKEFMKIKEAGYIVDIEDLPEEEQEIISRSPSRYYIAIAPALSINQTAHQLD